MASRAAARRLASMSTRFFSVSGLQLRLAPDQLRDELFLGQRFVGLGVHLGLLELGLERRRLRLLRQELVLELDPQVRRARPRADCSASRALSASCSTCGLLSSRITELGSTCAPGRSRIRSTRPSVVAGSQRVSSGHQRAEATHLADDRAALDDVHEHGGALDRRRRRLHAARARRTRRPRPVRRAQPGLLGACVCVSGWRGLGRCRAWLAPGIIKRCAGGRGTGKWLVSQRLAPDVGRWGRRKCPFPGRPVR